MTASGLPPIGWKATLVDRHSELLGFRHSLAARGLQGPMSNPKGVKIVLRLKAENASPEAVPELDMLEVQRIIAELGSDWAFVIRVEPDGTWIREWVSRPGESEGAGAPRDQLEAIDPDGWASFIAPEYRREALEHFARACREGDDRIEYKMDLGDENPCWIESSLRAIPVDREGTRVRVFGTMRDISDRVKAEQRIRSLAFFDRLTELPNREHFHQRLEHQLERSRRGDKRFALLFLDIDRFKQVNESLGHSCGDELLKFVADRLRGVLRGTDSLSRAEAEGREARGSNLDESENSPVARLGGDEFTVMVPGLEHPQDAARVARRVLHTLSRTYLIDGQEIFAGTSIGIAVWPEDGENAEDLVRSASTAMHHAKKRGGSAYEFFNDSMNVASSRRLNLETNLRRALGRDEFKLLYQPIRDVRTGRVLAAEALVRWIDSSGQMVGPDEFIPIAEETNLIVAIGEWVLRTACRQSVQWQAMGFEPVRMSVNVSVCQLRDLGLVDSVDQVLFETGLSPDLLELEITESSILDENPTITASVAALMEKGIGFALDDFGTGYSSLVALQRFPIDRLKIDRSFVAGVGHNPSDEALTSAIMALAKRLDHKVVAEGVEEEQQAQFLCELGCDELQGYLFSKPVPAEDFEVFLTPDAKKNATGPKRDISRDS